MYSAKGPIEQKYMADGPWVVTHVVTSDICDRCSDKCDVWYPTNLGTNPLLNESSGFHHPVIAWADGSGESPMTYNYWLQHLATWGFIVVAPQNGSTGAGDIVADAANYMIAQGMTSGSLFNNYVDSSHVGVAGHSQGGASVVSLYAQQTPPFTAYFAAHPAPFWFALLCCDLVPGGDSIGTNGSILFYQSVDDGGAQDTEQYDYDPAPATATKGFGVLAHAQHADISGQPGCAGIGLCETGVYGYLGYPTAWFMWKLQNAPDGVPAFDSVAGEFVQADANDWQLNETNVSGGSSSGGSSSGGSSSGSSSGGVTAPTASLQATPVTGTAPLAVSLDASASHDPNAGGSITGYAFNFGDGTTQNVTSGATNHTYAQPGSYTATVTVTDIEGSTASQSVVISVQSVRADAPSASLSVSTTSGAVPLAVSFDASGSYDVNGSITNYLFDFGDGSAKVSQTTATTSHTYVDAGTYQASVTVTNSFGNVAAAYVPIQATSTIVVAPDTGPVAELSLSPSAGAAPLTVTLDGSKSYDPDGIHTITSYTFNFGDGSAPVTQSSPTINYVYSQPGIYNPSLSVVDSAGTRSTYLAKAQARVSQAGSGGEGGGTGDVGNGGAFAPVVLLPMLIGAAVRRRRSVRSRMAVR